MPTKIFFVVMLTYLVTAAQAEDARQWVKMPEQMQTHMLSNMRDHLAAFNEILQYLAEEKLDKAAAVAERRLGMSSLELHDASHMAKFMPAGMQAAGTSMHHAASRFAIKAQEGDVLPAYKALTEITATCVACHNSYRIH